MVIQNTLRDGLQSETSVYYNETTRRYIPEGCQLDTRLRENLTSHLIRLVSSVIQQIICQNITTKVHTRSTILNFHHRY
jgi:hypothetical protein